MRPISLVLALAVLQVAPTVPSPGDQLFARFGEYVDALRKQAGVPALAVAIVGENDLLWEQAFGQQSIEQGIATRPDTPFHLDGLTQLLTATVLLQCVEEGRLSLDDPIGRFDADSPYASATIGQVLSHTNGPPGAVTFSYEPVRYEPLRSAIRNCKGESFRETVANLLDRLAMANSVPGADIVSLVPPAEGVPDPAAAERYSGVLQRLATSYAVPAAGQAIAATHVETTLTPSSGLVSTVRDFAQFDLALRKGVLLRPETIDLAWSAPVGAGGQSLPHGLGWFVQQYNGERVVWQFGVSDNASSSMVMTIPSRRLTLIMLANSDGLVKLFPLPAGDATRSPFARVFLRIFIS
jgi:CubicO group peptidase (beta-lactamase class C family)